MWWVSAGRWTSASIPRPKWMEEEIEVKVRNHKKEAVDVIVKENLYRWTNWQIKSSSQAYEKEDARTIHFPVSIARAQRGSGPIPGALLMVNCR